MNYHRLMELVGDEFGGAHDAIPGTQCRLEYGEIEDGRPIYIATTYNNDGFELWLGTWHNWMHHMSRQEAHRLAWFILWTWWGKGEWFGLRRRIYYWALHRYVASRINAAKEPQP